MHMAEVKRGLPFALEERDSDSGSGLDSMERSISKRDVTVSHYFVDVQNRPLQL